MRLETTVRTIITEKEWDTLTAAKVTLAQLFNLLRDYEAEAISIKNAIISLEAVMDDIIDDYE
ncbi:MAG: hypothetical protein ACM670_09200 [Clostridiales bacterium]